MKNIRLTILPVLLALITACDSNRQNATLGNTADTANTVEGASVPPSVPADTTKKGADTTARGNADPSGSIQKSNK